MSQRPASIDANARQILELLQERLDDLVARIEARVIPIYEADPNAAPIGRCRWRCGFRVSSMPETSFSKP